MILEAQSDLDVVGEAADGNDAVELARSLQPDVMLMDIRMPNLDGIEATKRVVMASPRTRVMMLTTFGEDGYVWQAMKAGASAFLLKDVPPEDLAIAVRTVARGDALLGPEITRRLARGLHPRPRTRLAADGDRRPDRPRAGGPGARRPWALERRNREAALSRRDDYQDARDADPRKARST